MEGVKSIVIFGASGDLTQRKLIPALFSLHCKQRLPANVHIYGFARTPMSDEEFQNDMLDAVRRASIEEPDAVAWETFAPSLHYYGGDISNTDDFRALDDLLRAREQQIDAPPGRLYYLATAPSLYPQAVAQLQAAGMSIESDKLGWRRVIVEKPFGRDLASARELNAISHSVFAEHQIYRIDHYLGKETVQNILVLRFGNTIFEPVWNRNYIDNVQITVAESVGVGHRARYYEGAGVLRDMFQNHLLQLLTLVAMEPPASFNADNLRNEKVKVLSAVRPMREEDIAAHSVRGQYRGYRDEPNVAPESPVATFGALRLYVDNWRWQGVPFFLRSGKVLADKTTTIAVNFKAPPHVMFSQMGGRNLTPNMLMLCVQPHEGIRLQFETKIPDQGMSMRSVAMAFDYSSSFGENAIPDAYERLLLDALQGDASLFTRSDEIELAWTLIDPIVQAWAGDHAPPLTFYDPGTWGPEEAHQLVAEQGSSWMAGCGEGQSCDALFGRPTSAATEKEE